MDSLVGDEEDFQPEIEVKGVRLVKTPSTGNQKC